MIFLTLFFAYPCKLGMAIFKLRITKHFQESLLNTLDAHTWRVLVLHNPCPLIAHTFDLQETDFIIFYFI